MPSLLIADDSVAKINYIRSYLERVQWEGEVSTAMTTEDALKIIAEHPELRFACIDYFIPSTNGPALIRAIKEKIPACHIALITSMPSERRFEEAKLAGAEHCIAFGWKSDVLEREMVGLFERWKGEGKGVTE